MSEAARAAIESGLADRVRSPSRVPAMAASMNLRILIVEDNRDTASSLKVLLDGLGYDTHVVNDGESSVGAALALRPQVILMDIAMPGLSGYDAARMIRAQCPDLRVRIVALTGLGQQIDRLRSAEAGIDHHLVKPLDLSVLQPILDFTWKPGVAV